MCRGHALEPELCNCLVLTNVNVRWIERLTFVRVEEEPEPVDLEYLGHSFIIPFCGGNANPVWLKEARTGPIPMTAPSRARTNEGEAYLVLVCGVSLWRNSQQVRALYDCIACFRAQQGSNLRPTA